MGQPEPESVIHRKAKVAREDFDAREMSPAKALRLSFAKSADAMFDLALVVRTVEHSKVPLTEIENGAGTDGLLILLDGESGAPGAVKLDLSCVMALIEVQLMGEVRAADAVERPFTPTDAAIVQPLMDTVLTGFADTLLAEGEEVVDRFQFGDMVEDGRTLALALSALDYDHYRMTIDFGPGAKTGVLELYLPQRPPAPKADITKDGTATSADLEEIALNAPVMLDAVLERMHCPLNEVCSWEPGTVLTLHPNALNRTRIVAAQGHEVAQVKLGQMNGLRAVRITGTHGPDAVAGPRPEPQDTPEPVMSTSGLLSNVSLSPANSADIAAAADAQIVTVTPEEAPAQSEAAGDLDPAALALMASVAET